MYTKEQMREASKFGWFHGNDSAEALRDGFESWLQALTTEPSADVVEGIAEALIHSGIRDDDSDMWCAKVAFFVAPIIEAEVERRIKERT